MINKKAFAWLSFAIMAALISDLVYRVYTKPKEFPYDLLIVIIIISAIGLFIVIPILRQEGKNVGLIAWMQLAALIAAFAGYALRGLYKDFSGNAIPGAPYITAVLTAMALVVVLILARTRARSKR